MFGILDTVDGKIEPSSAFYVENLDGRFFRVPKDYINHWASGHKCERDGCMDDGCVDCRLPNDAHLNPDANIGEVIEHFCPDHAFKNGYCICCGEFWGGVEDFDFGNGLCDNCKDAIDCEQTDYSDFDEWLGAP